MLIDKGMASAQLCETNNRLNSLRLKAFKGNRDSDKQEYFRALSLAFQRGDLIAYDLVVETSIE